MYIYMWAHICVHAQKYAHVPLFMCTPIYIYRQKCRLLYVCVLFCLRARTPRSRTTDSKAVVVMCLLTDSGVSASAFKDTGKLKAGNPAR